MLNVYIPPLSVSNPKWHGGAWAAARCAGRETGVGVMRVASTFLWMSDSSVLALFYERGR